MEFMQTVQRDPDVLLKISLPDLDALINAVDADYSPETDGLFNALTRIRNEAVCELTSNGVHVKVPTFGDILRENIQDQLKREEL